METKNIKEEIKNILEVLNEQFAIIDEHQKRIPQIELDIVMANIRHFYELFYELNKLNSYHKNSIDANIAVNFEIEKQEILSLPENKTVSSDEKPDNTTISIALEPEEKKSEIMNDTVIFKEEEVQETVGHESLPMEEIAEPIIEESQVQEEISASIVAETQVQEEIAEPIVAETIVHEQMKEPIIAETQVQEEIAEPIVEEIVLPIVEEQTIPEEIIIAETTPPVNELIITKVDVPEQQVEIELPKEVPVPMKTGKQQAIDLFSLTEKEIVADKMVIKPRADGKTLIEFWGANRKFADVSQVWTFENAVKNLQSLGAFTLQHVQTLSEYPISANIYFVFSDKKNTAGNPYKNVTGITKA